MSAFAKLIHGGRTLIIRVPMPLRRRGGRKFVVGPGGIAWTGRRVIVDNTLIKALGRAHRWKAMLESGDYASITDLAKAEKINLSYLCRVLRLTLLAPDIAEALLDGRHNCCFKLSDLLQSMPVIWADQRKKFERLRATPPAKLPQRSITTHD